jgi:hypothetical protein
MNGVGGYPDGMNRLPRVYGRSEQLLGASSRFTDDRSDNGNDLIGAHRLH